MNYQEKLNFIEILCNNLNKAKMTFAIKYISIPYIKEKIQKF